MVAAVSHPKDLLEMIAEKVRTTYPPGSGYVYEFERRIPGTPQVMIPDIWVSDESGKLVCAVEIGYTRPEKLTAYRRVLGLQDVRWYDKKGNLHGDVVEQVIIRKEFIQPPPDVPFRVIPATGMVCLECMDELTNPAPMDADDLAACDMQCQPEPMTEDAARKEASSATYGDYITNGIRHGTLVFCDECTASRIEIDPMEFPFYCEDDARAEWARLRRYGLQDPADQTMRQVIGLVPGAREMSIETLAKYAREIYGVDFQYADLANGLADG